MIWVLQLDLRSYQCLVPNTSVNTNGVPTKNGALALGGSSKLPFIGTTVETTTWSWSCTKIKQYSSCGWREFWSIFPPFALSSENSLVAGTGIHEHYNTCYNRIAEHASLLTMVEFRSYGRTKNYSLHPKLYRESLWMHFLFHIFFQLFFGVVLNSHPCNCPWNFCFLSSSDWRPI